MTPLFSALRKATAASYSDRELALIETEAERRVERKKGWRMVWRRSWIVCR